MGSFNRNCLGLQQFLPLTLIPTGFCSQKVWGLIFLALETWASGPNIGMGLLTPEISLLNFGTSLFGNCAPPNNLDGCGFFNSVVVRLPFNSISYFSECRLFYILVVILMLCKEVSLVCPSCHLDCKSASWHFPSNLFN